MLRRKMWSMHVPPIVVGNAYVTYACLWRYVISCLTICRLRGDVTFLCSDPQSNRNQRRYHVKSAYHINTTRQERGFLCHLTDAVWKPEPFITQRTNYTTNQVIPWAVTILKASNFSESQEIFRPLRKQAVYCRIQTSYVFTPALNTYLCHRGRS